MVISIAGQFCLARKRVEYLRNIVFYHRAKGEHPERKKNIKITNKTTPRKPGVRSMPVCQPAVLRYLVGPHRRVADCQLLTPVLNVVERLWLVMDSWPYWILVLPFNMVIRPISIFFNLVLWFRRVLLIFRHFYSSQYGEKSNERRKLSVYTVKMWNVCFTHLEVTSSIV